MQSVKLTPMMEQWTRAKATHPDAILLFRMGDFYELFDQDALLAAPVLELALTSRDKDKNGVKMAGFPIHSAEGYIAKLVELGHKVALCEQLEDPKASKGIVKRGITQILSPGTLIESEEALSSSSSYLVSLSSSNKQLGLCALDLNTASFLTTYASFKQKMLDEIIRLKPKELLVDSADTCALEIAEQAQAILARQGALRVEKKNILCEEEAQSAQEKALKLIRAYVSELKGFMPAHIGEPKSYSLEEHILMDESTRLNLDLLPKKKGHRFNLLSLFLQECKTAMGRRALSQAVVAPSTSLDLVNSRHDLVAELDNHMLRLELKNYLRSVGDLEKLVALAASQKISPRGLSRLRDALVAISSIKNLLALQKALKIKKLLEKTPELHELESDLAQALVEQPPLTLKEGGIFRKNFDTELDKLYELSNNGHAMLLALEAKEREATGINSLKIKYTRVFGYYIEVTRTHLERVPSYYQRKQTIANGERYFTSELSELEIKLSSAHEQLAECEALLFEKMRLKVLAQAPQLLELARFIALLDMLQAFAELAHVRRWVRPHMLEAQECVIDIQEGRHPIIEDICLAEGAYFVPNSLKLDNSQCSLALITGPNMAGKSTIMRQVALIQIMAQMGSFVPAKMARLSICDSIFARVGASDDLASGRSTFMVEMSETAYILQHASPHSLIILDEIGRGTSTYDGLSIAQAVAEYIHNKLSSRTLFATHYHELCELEKSLNLLKNFHVQVEEHASDVKFLYTLGSGPAQESFGIQVAKLAGLPPCVVNRARVVLKSLETKSPIDTSAHLSSSNYNISAVFSKTSQEQPDLFGLNAKRDHALPLSEQIARLDINKITPLQAMNKLQSWQSIIREHLRAGRSQ